MLKMGSDEECEDLLFLLALYRKYKKRKGKRRRYWVRPIFSKRKDRGSFGSLVQEMRVTDPQSHFRYFVCQKKDSTSFCTRYADHLASEMLRMISRVLHLLQVGPLLSRRYSSSSIRPQITPAERLSVGLRFLATGNSQV